MKGYNMRSVNSHVNSHADLLSFQSRSKSVLRARARDAPQVGPLHRIELHQVEHDEVASLRTRLLKLILDNEQARKVSRLRLVN